MLQRNASRRVPYGGSAHSTARQAPEGDDQAQELFPDGRDRSAPLAITAYLAWSFIRFVDSWVKPYIPLRYNPDNYLPFAVPGFGLIVALVAITLVGFLTANFVGKTVVAAGENLLDRMPLVRNVYRGLKQIFTTVLANRSELFTKVGLVEWPRRGTWSIVFIARQQHSELNAALEEREGKTIAVFRPITPNITTGTSCMSPRRT